jgi:RNA polymerase sigma-70 factor (ECF subfamily)
MEVPELAISGSSDDDQLAALAREAGVGKPGAFEELARRVRRRVYGWAHRVMHDDDEAEDVAQLVLLKLERRVSQYEGRSRFTTWLYRITRNLAIDRRNAEGRRRSRLERAHAQTDLLARDDHTHEPPQVADLVRRYLGGLTPRQREVFVLSDLQGLDARQIGARLGISPSTVRVLLLRARRTIRIRMLEHHSQLLEEYGDDL